MDCYPINVVNIYPIVYYLKTFTSWNEKKQKKKKQNNIKELIYLFYVITFTIHIISHFILFYNSAH